MHEAPHLKHAISPPPLPVPLFLLTSLPNDKNSQQVNQGSDLAALEISIHTPRVLQLSQLVAKSKREQKACMNLFPEMLEGINAWLSNVHLLPSDQLDLLLYLK